MSPAGLAVTSVTRLPFPSNWFLDNTSAINCIPGLGLPDQIRSMTQLTEYLLWQSSAPTVPEEDQNIPLVDSHDIISPLGRFLSVPELQNILGEYQKTDTCYFIALSKVTLNVHKDMNFFFLSGTQLHTLPCCHFAAVVSAGCMSIALSSFGIFFQFLGLPHLLLVGFHLSFYPPLIFYTFVTTSFLSWLLLLVLTSIYVNLRNLERLLLPMVTMALVKEMLFLQRPQTKQHLWSVYSSVIIYSDGSEFNERWVWMNTNLKI